MYPRSQMYSGTAEVGSWAPALCPTDLYRKGDHGKLEQIYMGGTEKHLQFHNGKDILGFSGYKTEIENGQR